MTINKILRFIEQADNKLHRFLGTSDEKPAPYVGLNEPQNQMLNSLDMADGQTGPCDTVCVNDKSGSMGDKDCQPSRLEASKLAVQEYIMRRRNLSPQDRIAIVAFTGSAEVILPLTPITQIEMILEHLSQLNAGGSTDINEGLKAAERLLFDLHRQDIQEDRFKRILLLTDGHGGNPIRTAKRVKEKGVLVEVIGIGGDPRAVYEKLLRKVATTDPNGFTHYWFFKDTLSLVSHYKQLATGIMYRGHNK